MAHKVGVRLAFLLLLIATLQSQALYLSKFLYLCICVLVFVYLCMRHSVISVLISLDQKHSENMWFVWSKTTLQPYYSTTAHCKL